MQTLVAAGLLASGEFQIVRDMNERVHAIAGFQRRVRTLGIPATFTRCDTIGLLAGVSADSSCAYGAACAVKIGSKPSSIYLVCDDALGGIALVQPDAFAASDDFLEIFMRRSCF